MKDDRLKDFIQWNKDEFDSEEVSNDLWNKIDEQLGEEKKSLPSKARVWQIAASIAILIGAGILFWNHDIESNSIANLGTEENTSPFDSGLAEIDHHYAMVFAEKTAELAEYDIDPELKEELQLLVDEFAELREELKIGANPELVLEAMIDNYRLRISILEDLLQDLKQERQNPTDNDDEIV